MYLSKLYTYIFQKIFIGLISVISIIALITMIIYLSPVDPARLQFGQRSDPETIELMKRKFYLDKSYGEQIFRYLEDLSILQWVDPADLRLEDYSYNTLFSIADREVIIKYPYLRRSFTTGDPVYQMISNAFPATLVLAFSAMIIAVLFGLFLGILSAVFYNQWIDHSITSLTTLCYAIPSYISAILFALFFGYYLHAWTGLPVQGSLYSLDDFGNEYLNVNNLILPSIALGIRPVAMISQMTRASLLEVFSREFVRTAVSMGLKEKRVLFRHIFPNALNPIITTISGWFASLLTGAFFVEFVFNYRGIGDLTIQALSQFDLPVILACCIVTVCIFILVNILADILYAVVDPRIRI